jgi:dolichyl-phosphate-mannose-protein mannosyltransferase
MATDTELRPSGGTLPDPERSGRGGLRRAGHLAWIVPLALVLVAGGLRFYRLGEPDRIYFDEVYYAPQGAELLARGVEEGFAVHPPVGKWVVAAGIAAVGDTPLGWRTGMAVAGTLTVLVTYLAGLRLFRRRGLAALAALLVAVDGLAFTMSRIAMLDAALALFVVTGFWLLLLDRDAQWAGLAPVDADPAEGRALPRRPHRYRWLAGLALGLAVATKWSGLLAIGGAGLFVLGSELAFRRRTTGSWTTGWGRLVASGLVTLVAVPAVVYIASYAGWFASYEATRPGIERCEDATSCAPTPPQIAGDWLGEQRDIAAFHAELTAEHGYRASPLTWPVLLRPVAYYYDSCSASARAALDPGEACPAGLADDEVAEILGIGNPALWWVALLAYPVLAWAAIRRRSWPAAAIGVLLLAQYLPWLAASRPLFLFYMTPNVPFIALSAAFAAGLVARHPLLRWVPTAVGALVVAAFVYWYPILSGVPLAEDVWRSRMWLTSWI